MSTARIEHAEVLRLAIPLRVTFRHALAARSTGDSVVVRLTGGGVEGHGECAPRDYVSGETTAGVGAVIARLLPRFVGHSFASLAAAEAALEETARGLARDEHAAFCALELAVLDFVGRATARSAGEVLGEIVRGEVEYSGVVSADGAEGVRAMCERIRQLGLRDVKLKVGGGDAEADTEALLVAREVLGPEVALRVDANCAWNAAEAVERVRAFAPFRLVGVEQPLAADDLDGMAWLTSRSPVPIIADEALVSIADAERLIQKRACHVFNVRISKCGGLLASRRIRDLGAAHGIASMLGAQVGETSLLSAAGRHFATRTAGVLHCEGSFGEWLLERDVARDPVVFGLGGTAAALHAPGLGVDVDVARLRAFASPLAS